MTHYVFDANAHQDYLSAIGVDAPADIPDMLAFTIDDDAVAKAKSLLSELPEHAFIQLPVEVFETVTDEHGAQRIERYHGNYYNAYVTVGPSDNHVLEVEFETGDMPELVQMEIQLVSDLVVTDEFMNDLNGAHYNSSMEP